LKAREPAEHSNLLFLEEWGRRSQWKRSVPSITGGHKCSRTVTKL
jgi:hypothetical protein